MSSLYVLVHRLGRASMLRSSYDQARRSQPILSPGPSRGFFWNRDDTRAFAP